jgi:trehalose 6-phosphate synthase
MNTSLQEFRLTYTGEGNSMIAGTQQPPLLAPLTQEDMGTLQVHLPALKIISYRGPGQSGGVVTSLSPLTKQLGTKVHWIALSGVPTGDESQLPGFSFHKAELPAALADSSAKAINDYLWPLLHGLPERANFDQEAWRSFRQLNNSIANQSLRAVSQSFPTLIWLHDFEVSLVPSMLPSDAGVVLSHFFHAPWPDPATIKRSPVGVELVESLLANRILGFHTNEYLGNFLETVKEVLPKAVVDKASASVEYRGCHTTVVSMPLGIDFNYWQRLARANRVAAESIPVKYRLAQQVLLGVDRLDYTKGIIEKLSGLETFLERNQGWQRRFHYVQLAQPGESRSQSFDDYRGEVVRRVNAINEKYRVDGWEPIVYIEGNQAHNELAAWYQAADVLVVTPVRDGLNLIAKEYVACRTDEQGSIVLSNRAGSSCELVSGALLVDPLSKQEIADALSQALTMGVEEKRRRMVSMRHVVGWNRLHDWACGFLRQAIATLSPSAKAS